MGTHAATAPTELDCHSSGQVLLMDITSLIEPDQTLNNSFIEPWAGTEDFGTLCPLVPQCESNVEESGCLWPRWVSEVYSSNNR